MKLLTPAYDVSIIYSKLIFKTVEAEITAIMPLQRTCGAESQVRNKLSNGPLRVQSNGISQSILQRVGIRQLPGICWYPAKCTGHTVNQGGTADSVVLYLYLFVLDRVYISVKDVFVLHESSFDGRYKSRELFPVLRR